MHDETSPTTIRTDIADCDVAPWRRSSRKCEPARASRMDRPALREVRRAARSRTSSRSAAGAAGTPASARLSRSIPNWETDDRIRSEPASRRRRNRTCGVARSDAAVELGDHRQRAGRGRRKRRRALGYAGRQLAAHDLVAQPVGDRACSPSSAATFSTSWSWRRRTPTSACWILLLKPLKLWMRACHNLPTRLWVVDTRRVRLDGGRHVAAGDRRHSLRAAVGLGFRAARRSKT